MMFNASFCKLLQNTILSTPRIETSSQTISSQPSAQPAQKTTKTYNIIHKSRPKDRVHRVYKFNARTMQSLRVCDGGALECDELRRPRERYVHLLCFFFNLLNATSRTRASASRCKRVNNGPQRTRTRVYRYILCK